MSYKGNQPFAIAALKGLNQDEARLFNELPDCNNIIGEATGFSIWKGRVKYSNIDIGSQNCLMNWIWPDGHESLVITGENGVQVSQIGAFADLTGDHSFNPDQRNPVSLSTFLDGTYAIGANYLRDKPWYWDGHIDHNIQELPVGDNYRSIIDWADRLWGLGSEENPLFAFYGELDELEIKAGNFLKFRDSTLASKIVGMRPYKESYAYIWGDRGLWMVQRTGSWPVFLNLGLIHADCDCVSNNSIVPFPGGFAWMGVERMWAVSNGIVSRIDLSPDVRQAKRIKDILGERSFPDLYRASGSYKRDRMAIRWSFPTKLCDVQNVYRDPKSIIWKPADNTWWVIDQGYEGAAEIEYLHKRREVVTDQDGYLYLSDYNISQDKGTNNVPWYVFFEWFGGAKRYKFQKAMLERELRGVDKVMVDFYDEYDSTPISSYFSMSDVFDPTAAHPAWDPGGPNDTGLPPDAPIICETDIELTGKRIKVKLSNKYNGSYYDGPEVPMKTFAILAKSL